ncbi:MAG: peptidase T [Solobacterium sp.]|jgi:tripeptide aminopeptidase|nr:peptidase T [Solobacterium sp.]MCH4222820.1 peptidase T [Solobacterium sp.]MCH4266291.1 peptidase T [Solobacterium sp.]
MSAEQRLIRYCRIDTQSNPDNEAETPSSRKQFDLGKLLLKELKELGIKDASIDTHCYVYGHLEANNGKKKGVTVGFIAHMDTAPDYSGTHVKPRIIRNFDGRDIKLSDTVVTKMKDFPQMKQLKGKDLIVTDGTTLLGADDKAGITCIMEALAWYQKHPEVKHGRIAIAFTPDEEIGCGTKFFDLKKFHADFAYTMDGGTVRELSDETFNAASAEIEITGFSIHPGEAKNRMINAASIAASLHCLLPEDMTPEHTEGREGFIHLGYLKGDTDHAEMAYILRDHDAKKLKEKKQLVQKAVDYINAKQGQKVAVVKFSDTYRNMNEVLKNHPQVSRIAEQAMKELNLEPLREPVRGGTDGALLSFRGLPCPNLGNGGGNFHGRYEYCVIQELEQASLVIRKIAELVSREE